MTRARQLASPKMPYLTVDSARVWGPILESLFGSNRHGRSYVTEEVSLEVVFSKLKEPLNVVVPARTEVFFFADGDDSTRSREDYAIYCPTMIITIQGDSRASVRRLTTPPSNTIL